MSTDNPNGMEQARAARQRAEREYEEAIAQRPDTIATAAKAVKLRNENHFMQSIMQAMQAIRSTP